MIGESQVPFCCANTLKRLPLHPSGVGSQCYLSDSFSFSKWLFLLSCLHQGQHAFIERPKDSKKVQIHLSTICKNALNICLTQRQLATASEKINAKKANTLFLPRTSRSKRSYIPSCPFSISPSILLAVCVWSFRNKSWKVLDMAFHAIVLRCCIFPPALFALYVCTLDQRKNTLKVFFSNKNTQERSWETQSTNARKLNTIQRFFKLYWFALVLMWYDVWIYAILSS